MIDLTKIFIPDFPLVVAISGGVDSMVLLEIILQKIPKNQIFVAHFNHNLRGDESDGDEIFVADFCKKNNLKFFSKKMNIADLSNLEKSSLEATARKYRYDFLFEICNQNNCKNLLTAHHLDDRIETAIFNLIRGSKFAGISALKKQKIQENIKISRPLLDFTKSEILAFAKENNIFFREDSTNINTDFQRNFLRHEILPKFAKINENYQKSLANFIDYIEENHDFQQNFSKNWIDLQNQKFFTKKQKIFTKNNLEFNYIFNILDFKNLEKNLQFSIIEYFFREKNNGSFGLSEGVFEEIFRFIFEGKNSFGKKIFKNLILERRGDFIYIL